MNSIMTIKICDTRDVHNTSVIIIVNYTLL